MTGRRARRGLRVPPAIMRLAAGQLGGRALDPALPWPVQRRRLDQASRIPQLPRGTTVTEQTMAGPRWLVIGRIDGKHWSAVVTYREEKIRIISVRRSRDEEVVIYEG